jgi:ABC-type Fe3+-hydroxamate transport system substrate-binding protein
MVRQTRIAVPLGFLALLLFIGCSSNSQPASSGVASSPPAAAPATAKADQDNSKVCALFSSADAEKIMGAPMTLKANRGQTVCMYEEVTARPNSIGTGTVALTLIQHKTAEEENLAWGQLKEVRHLQPGQKNVQVLTGIGDEAYFTGNTQKGKVGVAGVIVRKGNSHFMLDSMVLEYVASPDALKAVARRIASQL